MKRKQFLNALTAFPILAVAACEKGFPSTPTVVTGKVIDENNLPVEGVEFIYGGARQKGLSYIPTFDINILTDKEGIYKGSFIVTGDTDFVTLKPIGNAKFDFTFKYDVLFLLNGIYTIVGSPIPIQRNEYGTIVTLNFQIKKR